MGHWLNRRLQAFLGAIAAMAMLFGAVAAAWAYEFAPKEYEQLRDLSLAIMTRYPPNEYVYVGVGRSPTPITAFMQSILPGSALNLPLSGLRETEEGKPGLPMGERRARLERHLARFFPQPAVLRGRKVVLMDFSFSGNSLLVAGAELARLHPEVRFDLLALSFDSFSDDVYANAESAGKEVTVLELAEKYFGVVKPHFAVSTYKHYAEFDQYHVEEEASREWEGKPLPGYADLKSSFASRAARDPRVRSFMAALEPRWRCLERVHRWMRGQ